MSFIQLYTAPISIFAACSLASLVIPYLKNFPYRNLLIFTRSYSEVARSCSSWSCSEFLGATLSLPVAPPTGTYSYLLGAARSYLEFIGVPRSNSVVASCSPLVTGTYSYLLGAALSCSELLGATLSLQVASRPTGTYRYSHLLAATRSYSEQKCLSHLSHSKCTNGTGQRLENFFLTHEGNAHFYKECFFHRSFLN